MKKIISLAAVSIMMAAAFTGCGENAASTASQAASDAVSGAGRVVDDVGSGVSRAASEADSAMEETNSETKNNGEVEDGDGFIGDSGEETQSDTEATVTASDVSE